MGNLGHDLSPSNFFSDTGKDFKAQPSWLKDLEIAAPLVGGAFLTGGADLGLLGGAGGLGDIFGGGAAVAADTGAAVDLGTGATDALGFAGDVGAGTGAASGGALGAIDTAIGAGGGGGAGLATAVGDTVGGGLTGAGGVGTDLATAVGDTVGGGVAGGGGGGTGFLSSLGDAFNPSTLGSTLGKTLSSPMGLLGGAGVAASLYGGYEQKQAQNALTKTEAANATNAANIASTAQSIAAPLINQGTTLTGYLTSGTLPPQFQTQVDQTIASQKAGIIQGYASRGQPTDPMKNSQLQQDLAAVENSKNTLMTQLESQLSTAGTNMINTANQLLSQGLAATQLESEIPIQISKLNEQLNKDMMSSISNFAAAMNGGRNITSAAA